MVDQEPEQMSDSEKAERVSKPLKKAAKEDGHLITVTNDGKTLRVHPTALADHQRLGWKEA